MINLSDLEPNDYLIFIGLHDITKPDPWTVYRYASKIILHPFYDPHISKILNDIALIKLNVYVCVHKN